jgi:transposase-like protein
VIAHGVHESGRREVLGLDCGEAETEAFWREFLRGLVKRGLSGCQLVVSDAHEGLKQAIAQVLGCPWQRCTVHFLREALGHARREQQPMLAALIRPIFNAASGAEAREARHSSDSNGRCRSWPRCSSGPRRTCSPSTPSRPSTGASCARRTRSSG